MPLELQSRNLRLPPQRVEVADVRPDRTPVFRLSRFRRRRRSAARNPTDSAGRTTGCYTSSNRRPGLTIAELLEILRITKQSLNRVLRELVDKNFIEARAGALDRRRRSFTQRRTANASPCGSPRCRRAGSPRRWTGSALPGDSRQPSFSPR